MVQLLRNSGLPIDGLVDHLKTALVARDGADVVGCAAIELYAEGALLRSVAVAPTARRHGVGGQLTQAAIALARSFGAPALYLLTTTAAAYFPRFGFVQTTRSRVPAGVQQSAEFRSACPASAIVMWKVLNESEEG